jgi:hypothetical protein
MDKTTVNQNVLKNCYKNAKMAILSIEDILPKCEGAFKEELISQHEGYNNHLTEIALTAVNTGIDLPDVSAFSKGMLNASINMKTMIDDSHSHLAEMLIKGSVMGYTTLFKDLSEYGALLYDEVYKRVDELKRFEETCENNLKKFL